MIGKITALYQDEISKWGNLSNPNRNVARGAGAFGKELDALTSNYVSPFTTQVTTPITDTFSVTFDANGSPALFNRTTGVTTPVSELSGAPATSAPTLQMTDTSSNYIPIILVGVGILALFLIFRKK